MFSGTAFESLSEHRKGIVAVFIAALLWSTGGVFIKLITWNSLELSFYRSLFSALIVAVIFGRRAFLFNKGTLINALFYTAVLILFVVATKTTTSANAIFLQYTAPIYVLIFEPLIMKTEFRKINVITIVICFIGMTLFFMGELQPGHFEGNLVALLTGISLAGFFIGMRKNKKEYQYATIFWGNIFIAVICLPFGLSVETFSLGDFSMVAYLGLIQIGLAYIIFTYGIERIQAIEASLIAMIEPVLNPVWVMIGYGERPTIFAVIGGFIILSAIVMKTLVFDRRKEANSKA